MAAAGSPRASRRAARIVLGGDHTYATSPTRSARSSSRAPRRRAWCGASRSRSSCFSCCSCPITWLFAKGVGIWGVNQPVGWGFAIINFVWWVGIGHAGTLISAILLLLRQKWRTSINRFAEAMTLFAVSCAGLYPILHLGRPERFYWLFPYPNTMGVWPQFRSPLVWDVFAVSTYATVSLLFWYIGLIPDLATMRDSATTKRQRVVYGMLAMGWRGAATHWHRYETAYLLLAGLATPLVISVHTVVGLDFAVLDRAGMAHDDLPALLRRGRDLFGLRDGRDHLRFPLRKSYGLKDLITDRHLDNMAKVMLATGLIVVYGYAMEVFMAWYSGSEAEAAVTHHRLTGSYSWSYYALLFFNAVVLQLLWFKRVRRNIAALFVISIVRQHRHVARALRDRRHEPLPRLHAVRLGHVHPDLLGLRHVRGDPRPLLLAALPLHPVPSRHLDVRDARAARPSEAGGRPSEGGAAAMTARLWGLLAEFETPERLVAAAASAKALGLRKIEAYTPFPVEGLRDALGVRTTRLPLSVLVGGILGAVGGFGLQYWVVGHRVPDEHRREARQQLARVHPDHVRDDDPVRRALRGPGDAGRERSPAAQPPAVRRARVPLRFARPLLPRVSAEDPKFDARHADGPREARRRVSVEEVAS